MVNITLIELHADEGSFSANLPFGSGAGDEDENVELDEEAEIDNSDSDSKKGKGLAVIGVFLFMIAAAAVVKYLRGDDELPDVDIDTEEEPSVELTTNE